MVKGCWMCKLYVSLSYMLKGLNYLCNVSVNTLRPRQNGRHFPDDIFKCIFLNENVWISLQISLKSVPKVQINNILAIIWSNGGIVYWRIYASFGLNELRECKYTLVLPQVNSERQRFMCTISVSSRSLQVNLCVSNRSDMAGIVVTVHPYFRSVLYIDGLVQERCHSSALAMDNLPSAEDKYHNSARIMTSP